MRWILFCLISFNVLYFGWMQFRSSGASHVGAVLSGNDEAGSGATELVLLKEMLPEAGSSVPPPTIDASSRFINKPKIDVVPKEDVVVADNVLQLEASQSEAVSSPEPETAIDESAPESAELIVEEESLDDPLMERVCAQVGPYDEREAVELMARSVVDAGLSVNVREEAVVSAVDNWVLIPSLGSRKEALKMLRELQGNKIDSYLVTEGEFRNAISLGLFKKAASAQGVLEKMQSAGYEARVEKIERLKPQFWATVSGEFEVGQSLQMLSQLVEDREKIIFSESLCEMFASTP